VGCVETMPRDNNACGNDSTSLSINGACCVQPRGDGYAAVPTQYRYNGDSSSPLSSLLSSRCSDIRHPSVSFLEIDTPQSP